MLAYWGPQHWSRSLLFDFQRNHNLVLSLSLFTIHAPPEGWSLYIILFSNNKERIDLQGWEIVTGGGEGKGLHDSLL